MTERHQKMKPMGRAMRSSTLVGWFLTWKDTVMATATMDMYTDTLRYERNAAQEISLGYGNPKLGEKGKLTPLVGAVVARVAAVIVKQQWAEGRPGEEG